MIRRTAGKAAKSNGAARYTATISKITAIEMLSAIRTSMMTVGRGMTSMKITETTNTAKMMSCRPESAAEIRLKKDIESKDIESKLDKRT